MKLKQSVPQLRMFDVAKAREFYIGFLGFKVDFEARFAENAPLYMGVSRDDITFHLSEHHGDGTPGSHVLVETDDVDAYHAELIAKNYKFNRPGIQDQEWGRREMTVVDPCNNRITFSQRIG